MKSAPTPTPRPWYRHFWPWFLLTLLGSVVVACIITISIAFNHPDSVVRDNYYKDGLAINRELAATERARQMNLSAELVWRQGDASVEVTLTGEPVAAAELSLSFIHPRAAAQDVELTLRAVSERSYSAALPAAVPEALNGSWELSLSPTVAADWQLRGQIDFHQQRSAKLQP